MYFVRRESVQNQQHTRCKDTRMGAKLGLEVTTMELLSRSSFEDAVSKAVSRLSSVRYEAGGSFISTANMYPSGGSVVVWVRRDEPHFYVSDYGYAYRECAIMGADPKTSAVNRYLQSWDVHNLFVLGASAFPQSAGKNPTGPVAATTLWAADAIKSQYLKSPAMMS